MSELSRPADPASHYSRELARRLTDVLRLAERPLVHAPAGATLLQAGDSVARLPFVVQGRVDSVLHLHGGDGARVIPVSWRNGEVVLLSQLFVDGPSFIDLVVGEALHYRWVAVAEIEEALLADRDLLVLQARYLAHRLREVQVRERGWVERGVPERVRAILDRLAQDAPRDSNGDAVINATHEELAERSGVSRPKLSQELKRLEQAGLVRLERKYIRVLTPSR